MNKTNIYILLSSIFFVPKISSAAAVLGNPITTPTFQAFMDKIFELVIRIGAMVLTIMLIYTGYLFVVAQGKEEQLSTAKTSLKWVIIGGAILIGSSAISYMISGTVSAL